MPGNPGQAFNLDRPLVRDLSSCSPIGDDTRVVEPKRGGRFGEAAKLGDDAVNGVLRLLHAADYHTA